MTYRNMLLSGARPAEVADYVVGGETAPLTIRVPVNLRDSVKEAASMKGMSVSALVRNCLIRELVEASHPRDAHGPSLTPGPQTAAKYGAVYTPADLAMFVARLCSEQLARDQVVDPVTVLDPACGELALLKAVRETRKVPGSARFVGIDIDPEAISASEGELCLDPGETQLFLADFLVPAASTSAEEHWSRRLGGVDLVVANPPWSSDRIYPISVLKEAGFELAVGQYDSYSLFVELSLKILRKGGTAAFILPDSIFAGEGEKLRKLLAEEYTLKVIARLGEKLFPGINRSTTVVVVTKEISDGDSPVECFRLNTASRASVLRGDTSLIDEFQRGKHTVRQRRFQNARGYAFDVDARQTDEKLLEQIRSSAGDWSQELSFGRGVEISKTGLLVRCPHCELHQGVSKMQANAGAKRCTHCRTEFQIGELIHAIGDTVKPESVPVLVGEDVHRYAADRRHYLSLGFAGVSYKDARLYDAPKLLVRKTGLGINAVIDETGSFVTQTVYVLKSTVPGVSEDVLWYYLAVLNSRLVFYYYLKTSGENEWKSHPYLTKEILFALPVKVSAKVPSKTIGRIADLARRIQGGYSRELDLELDGQILDLYGINSAQRAAIAEEIDSLPSLRAFDEMKV